MDAGKIFTAVVVAIISMVLLIQLGTSVLAPSVTTASNSSAIGGGMTCGTYGNASCFNTWDAGSRGTWSATPGLAMLVYFLLFFVILVAAVKMVDA